MIWSKRLITSIKTNCSRKNVPSLSSFSTLPSLHVSKDVPTHIIFGANTDVGKTIVSTSLVRSHVQCNPDQGKGKVHYIKPLQCGGSDEGFVTKHVSNLNGAGDGTGAGWEGHTLFNWDTPASPHLASRLENKPMSDEQVLSSLYSKLSEVNSNSNSNSIAMQEHCGRLLIETAGGVLSPSSASPDNNLPKHANASMNNSSNKSSSASWGWSTQADLYKPLQLPAVLVGDGRLGGISATLSALESLIIRGYDVHGIVFIDDNDGEHGSNLPALREYASRILALRSGSGRSLLKEEGSIVSLPPIPDISIPLDEWFASNEVVEQTARLDDFLCQSWRDHVDVLQGLRENGKESLWWPFTQHQGHNDNKITATVIDGATGDNFSILHDNDKDGMERTSHFDACASWWTQGMGHGETSLGLAAAAAAGKFGHVIFPDVVHAPATELADRLLHSKSGPGRDWASRVFFTDDGSTAVEVAIKMGLKKFVYDREKNGKGPLEEGIKLTVCAQQDCYHGDTLGVMDVAEPSVFNEGQHPWYEPKGLFLSYPTIRYKDGKIGLTPTKCIGQDNRMFNDIDEIMNVDERLKSDLYSHYCDQIQSEWDDYEEGDESFLIGSVIIEPILLGAGGMRFIDPLWQRALMDIARSKDVPVIFDEVASGLYRVGVSSCREILKADPDIAAYAKLLTGGLVPMSVTLATEDVFNTYLGDTKGQALLHGHSYTAHPVGCVSSIHALDAYAELFEGGDSNEDNTKAFFDQGVVSQLSKLPFVAESMSLGTVVAVTLEADSGGSGYTAAGRSLPVVQHLMKNGVYARPLGNVVYIMVSPLTSREECSRLCGVLKDAILSLQQ
mmetsp:Transcript_23928/g.36440  ORF Transcript_23928/g.36440 Transcript_23928/m.36440 type:complete len:843 (-) Transcript_23928:42-2570(-)|eukprot:CAMPEP_0194121902 /NCGR_PEP_ID=MMETSP0150-20130528/48860_1 /TAXON_ID=122233 /ORGANISM="Chaetoceros debilis, Strain MM31A-1" /LENGTH=842 /DNA_ID=CAMNT_0038814561 /DNA_START=70 /DNA_END=2598 /DNA_ORIENTATION=-